LEEGVFKIGKANDPEDRRKLLEKEYGCRLIVCDTYPTVVDYSLERALHRHFRRFKFERDGRRELFTVPLDMVPEFSVLAAELEQHVLAAATARLELEMLRLELEAGRC